MKTRTTLTTLITLLGIALLPNVLTPLPASAQRSRNNSNRSQGSISWNGRIDDVVDVYFRQGRSWIRRVSGKSGSGEARFSEAKPLPQRNLSLMLRKNDGRGQVSIRQQPSKSNNYTAIVRVIDHNTGQGSYRFTLRWND